MKIRNTIFVLLRIEFLNTQKHRSVLKAFDESTLQWIYEQLTSLFTRDDIESAVRRSIYFCIYVYAEALFFKGISLFLLVFWIIFTLLYYITLCSTRKNDE